MYRKGRNDYFVDLNEMVVCRAWRPGTDEQPKGYCVQKDTKNIKKREKRTQTFDSEMLLCVREELKFAPRDMYRTLGIPRRTYQDYESGKRRIPESVAQKAIAELKWNRAFLAGIAGRVDEGLEREGWV